MPSVSTNSIPQCSLPSVPHLRPSVERGIAVFPEHAGSTSGKPATGVGWLHPWCAPCYVIESLRIQFCGRRECCLCVVVHSGQNSPCHQSQRVLEVSREL